MRNLLTLVLLSDLDEDSEQFHMIPQSSIPPLLDWMMKELLTEKVMRLDQWLEMAFHLCKQRWDDSVEWLEVQPMTKILLMSRIVSKFVAEQNREMKSASRRK